MKWQVNWGRAPGRYKKSPYIFVLLSVKLSVRVMRMRAWKLLILSWASSTALSVLNTCDFSGVLILLVAVLSVKSGVMGD